MKLGYKDHGYNEFLVLQAALAIRGFGIRSYDYSRTQKVIKNRK